MRLRTLVADDFQVASCQATLFTPDEEISTSKLVSGLLPQWSTRFDGDPIILPHVEGLPREVPKMILSSTSASWRCEIASARINIFWRRTKTAPPPLVPSISTFYADAAQLLVEYNRFLKSRVGRVAAVLNRYATHGQPGLFLARHFCQERWAQAPLDRPESFELHAHKRFTLANEFQVNSWVRNKTGQIAIERDLEPIVLVEQDLNTLPEDVERRSFQNEEFVRFFSVVANELDSILQLYYPRDGTQSTR